MKLSNWMSWEGGVDLVAATTKGAAQPNLILHVARMVHTPVGSAPAGMVLFQPDPAKPPMVMGFVSPRKDVGAYFGPKIFAGTPFEKAPVLEAKIEITVEGGAARSRIEVGGHVFETRLEKLGGLEKIERAPGGATPFFQQGLEAVAGAVKVTVDGKPVEVTVPPVGISGGPAAVFAPAGLYSR